MGGHGADNLQTCFYTGTVNPLPRCPQYDVIVSGNDGTSYQSGCGYDPYDTGCCIVNTDTTVDCYRCPAGQIHISNNTWQCLGSYSILTGYITERDLFQTNGFYDINQNLILCGKYQSPRYHQPYVVPQDYGIAQYYVSPSNPNYNNRNYRANLTSERYLCKQETWTQGDYIDDAGLGLGTGMGSIYGLKSGRHIRINYPNIIENIATNTFTRGSVVTGEGIYACANSGSCLAPDICSCTDGYAGYGK